MEKYGPVFSVHLVSRKHYTNIKQWEYKINKKVCLRGESIARYINCAQFCGGWAAAVWLPYFIMIYF